MRMGAVSVAARVLVLLHPSAGSAFLGRNGKIAFASDRDGNYEIYTMNADGSGQTQLTNTPTADEFFPAWSANGQKLLLHDRSRRRARPDLHGQCRRIEPSIRVSDGLSSDTEAAWAPNGQYLVYVTSQQRGRSSGYGRCADGCGAVKLTNTGGANVDADVVGRQVEDRVHERPRR